MPGDRLFCNCNLRRFGGKRFFQRIGTPVEKIGDIASFQPWIERIDAGGKRMHTGGKSGGMDFFDGLFQIVHTLRECLAIYLVMSELVIPTCAQVQRTESAAFAHSDKRVDIFH